MKHRPVRWSLLLSLLVLLPTSRSFCAQIGPGDFSSGATLINFDNLAGGNSITTGEIVTSQYAALGVNFLNPDFNSFANANLAALMPGQSDPNILFITQHNGNPVGRPQQIWFDSPMLRVGTFFHTSLNSTITLLAFSPGGMLLESITLMGTPNGPDFLTGFIGVEQAGGIGHIELFSRYIPGSPDHFNFGIDDFRFEPVPEPGTWALLAVGLAGVMILRRRSR